MPTSGQKAALRAAVAKLTPGVSPGPSAGAAEAAAPHSSGKKAKAGQAAATAEAAVAAQEAGAGAAGKGSVLGKRQKTPGKGAAELQEGAQPGTANHTPAPTVRGARRCSWWTNTGGKVDVLNTERPKVAWGGLLLGIQACVPTFWEWPVTSAHVTSHARAGQGYLPSRAGTQSKRV